jgi:hypothetical protein
MIELGGKEMIKTRSATALDAKDGDVVYDGGYRWVASEL